MKRIGFVLAVALAFVVAEESRQVAAREVVSLRATTRYVTTRTNRNSTFANSKQGCGRWTIRRIFVAPVPCAFKECWSRDDDGHFHHGTLHIEYSNGRETQVSNAPTALESSNRDADAKDEADNGPQISPDKTTAGWTTGRHIPCTDWSIGGTMFVNSQLVLFRRGKIFRVLDVPNTFIQGWRFWNNGKYVAVGSRWHHGVGYVRLFDVESGKLLERMTTPAAESRNLKWARDLTA